MDTDQTIDADTSRVSQLFDNLFRNAIKHGGEDVTVRVDWLADCPGCYIEDTRAGIPAEEPARVFESGYTTTTKGTGFGLAIVTEIVEAHGWEIDVTAGADREPGSRFGRRKETVSRNASRRTQTVEHGIHDERRQAGTMVE